MALSMPKPNDRLMPVAQKPAVPGGPDMGIAGGPTMIGTPAGAQTMTATPQPAIPGAPGASDPFKPTPGAGGGPRMPSSPSPTPGMPPMPTSGSSRINPQQLEGFDQFADAAYQSATRRLDPRFAQAEADFRQMMVNKGISEGTDAFDKAWANFSMDRNDAYSQAQNNALAQALAAQGQAFGQNFQNRSLAQQDSQFGRSLAEQGRQFDQNLGQRESEFGRQFGFQNQRADMQDLMALLGFGASVNQQNNSYLNSDFNRAGGLFGLIPGMSPTQVDVLGPYQMQQQAAAQANAQAGAASNGFWGSIGQIGAALVPGLPFMPSDERLKTDIRKVGVLDNGLPVYAYRYTHGGPTMLGVMAQEALEVRPEAVADLGGMLAVDYDKVVL